jgi:hypothetical protein
LVPSPKLVMSWPGSAPGIQLEALGTPDVVVMVEL